MVQTQSSPQSGPQSSPHSSRGRKIAAAAIVAAGVVFVLVLFTVSLTAKDAADRDFIGYWATGQQLARHANPYDAAAMMRLEQAQGYTLPAPRITPSPPVAFLLLLPLGWMGAKWGLIAWLLVQMGCVGLSVWLLWRMFGRPDLKQESRPGSRPNSRPDSRLHFAGLLFAPVLACLEAGQIGIFFLLGMMVFLVFHEKRPAVAGAGLLLCALKPHLFLPFVLVLALWMLAHRVQGAKMLAGFLTFLALNTAVTLWFDPHVWTQYLAMMHGSGIENRLTPTLGEGLREIFGQRVVWLQWAPEVVGCVWAVTYFWRRRAHWSWLDEGLRVLLVGVVCTPYEWLTDEAVVLPAVVAGMFRAEARGRSLVPIAVAGTVALVELMAGVQITGWGYVWTPLAWLGWYVYATGGAAPQA
ncbi:MAG TPA: glycosyltransferase family 87 protein [Terracidiphilus sp.]|nr:glycosyltransferase family 87 protein [Terracidiphilus sp.]